MGQGRKGQQAAPDGGDSKQTLDGWLWWRSEGSTRSRPKEAYDDLTPVVQAQVKALMKRYRLGITRQGDVKSLGEDILELRHAYRNNQYRLLFARWGRYGLVLDVFFKNQEKTDRGTAVSRLKAWRREHDSQS